MGQWQRALTQLKVLAEMEASTLPMVQAYREALQCEVLREQIFAGQRSPLVFGDPANWVAQMVQALALSAEGKHAEAQQLRERAFEEAPATAGSIDGTAFEWIADSDSRLGPILEAIVNGRYYWVPFDRIFRIDIEAPADLRDTVWTPANITWANGGTTVSMIPTRYPGSENGDGAIRLSRRTEWDEVAPDVFHGLGQRLLATDAGDYALMDVRQVQLDTLEEGVEIPEEQGDAEGG